MTKIEKVLNNSVLLARDGQDRELLVRAKGIAYGHHPGEEFVLPVNAGVSYLNPNERVQNAIENVSDEVVDAAGKILDFTKASLHRDLSPLLLITLSDHLDNSLKGLENGQELNYSEAFQYETAHLYKREYEIGRHALSLVKQELGVELPEYEAALITLHIINAEINGGGSDRVLEISKLTKACVVIIQREYGTVLDKNTIAFSKFVTLLRYLIERQAGQVTEVHDADDIDKSLSATLASMYPKAYTTATAIRDMLQERKHWQLDQNEIVYLVIHIERLVSHAKQS